MDKTIETTFFKSFSRGSVLSMCFDWMEEKYNLGFYLSKEDENKGKRKLSKEWRQHYDETLPKRIKEAIKTFDYTVIEYWDSPLMDEIANNLDECQNKEQRERYIYSLLRPFKEYSDKFNPISEIKKLKGEVKGVIGISELERELAMWQDMPQDENLKNINGEPCGTPKEQAEACKKMIEEKKYQIERAIYISNQYRELLGSSKSNEWLQDGTVENCMSTLHHYLFMFACRLDSLLLERGINLLWYQNECGIYLFQYRSISYVMDYIGSYELARKYIDDALPMYPEPQQENNTPMTGELTLPSELDTERARKYFAKAIDVGYIERTNNGYKWLFGNGRGQARLGYFCNKVYSTPRPISKLEQIFGVKKLSASITNADVEVKRADVKKWRKEIDDKIFEK